MSYLGSRDACTICSRSIFQQRFSHGARIDHEEIGAPDLPDLTEYLFASQPCSNTALTNNETSIFNQQNDEF
jgi:hypothetical protein